MPASPSGLKARLVMNGGRWPGAAPPKGCRRWPVAASSNWTVPSLPPDASSRPSGL
jgi:hypothetical protein